jgi:hypothetical protein
MKGTPNKTVTRAKSAKDAKVDFDKKRGDGRGLGVLGAINFLKLILFNNSLVGI